MTRVAVMQPYLFPALPYIQLAHAADVFVFYDDAQFSHGRWTHRNRIRTGSIDYLFTVPLEGRGPDRTLDAIALHSRDYPHWRRKFIATLRQTYARAPYANAVLPEIEQLLARSHHTLADLAADSVRWLAMRFGNVPRWRLSSAIRYDRSVCAQDKVLAMVESLGGAEYVNMPGGRALYDGAAFVQRGLRLGFMQNRAGEHDGLDLSALHAVMHFPPAELERLGGSYEIDWSDAA